MQTQSRPSRAHPPRSPGSGVHAATPKTTTKKTPPPVLASEVLREDLAPLEPGRRASRFWDGGVALLFLAVAVCLRFDLGVGGIFPQSSAICLAAAAATGATGLVPFPYLWRAVVGGAAGAAVVGLGLFGVGPLALIVTPPSTAWIELFRVITCITLPAALLFRSHYRAYERGRLMLFLAFVLAVPFLVPQAMLALKGAAVPRVGAALAMVGALSGLFAFMSSPTTSMMAWCGQALIALVSADIGLRQLYAAAPAGAGPLAYVLTAVTFFASVVPIALGMFQTFAAIYAREARLVDVHRPSQPSEADGPVSPD